VLFEIIVIATLDIAENMNPITIKAAMMNNLSAKLVFFIKGKFMMYFFNFCKFNIFLN
jgi:hypothetical protein